MAIYRSLAELADTTQDLLLPGIIDGLKDNDEFTAVLVANAQVTDRPTIKGNRVVSEGSADYVGCDDTITPAAISGAPFQYDLETINRSFDVCVQGQNLHSSFTDVMVSEMGGAISAISKKIAEDAMVGSAGAGTLVGLETQITGTVAQGTAGAGNFDLGDLDNLFDLVRGSNDGKVMVGAPATVNVVKAELRAAAGGTNTAEVQGTNLLVPSFYDVPILKNQYCSAGTLSIVDLAEFKLWLGISEDEGTPFSVLPVGALADKLRKRYHMYVQAATVLENLQGAASLTGVA